MPNTPEVQIAPPQIAPPQIAPPQIAPLISESSSSESTSIEVVLGNIRGGDLRIPDYQRDSDQWDDVTKSLLIESVINNLTIPAFFFEFYLSDGIEVSEVVDGQQRLTTLNSYFNDEFTLVSSDEAPYISPNSVYYAEKRFSDLPKQYQSSFKKYRLSIIKLRNLGDMKLEIFRRINQGGTPLSGQDIRLAYYGDTSKSVVFIRLTGVYDKDRASSVRTIKSAKEKHEMSYPWVDDNYRFWNEWWLNKDISYGQRASEMFLWSLLSIYYENLSNLLHNHRTLNIINCRYHNTIDEALDAFCGYLKHQDKDETVPRLFMSYEEMSTGFVSYFMNAFSEIVLNGASLPATKHRLVASTIGNLYKRNKRIEDLSPEKITNIIEFIRKPQIKAQQLDFPTFPSGKGRWAGGGGYYKQFEAVKNIIERIIE